MWKDWQGNHLPLIRAAQKGYMDLVTIEIA